MLGDCSLRPLGRPLCPLTPSIGAFGNSDEFNRRYGGLTNTQLITKIYQQALARSPEQGGLDYYVGELLTGRRTLQTITLDVLNGATTPPDSTSVANKLDVAAYYTAKVAVGCAYGTEQDRHERGPASACRVVSGVSLHDNGLAIAGLPPAFNAGRLSRPD